MDGTMSDSDEPSRKRTKRPSGHSMFKVVHDKMKLLEEKKRKERDNAFKEVNKHSKQHLKLVQGIDDDFKLKLKEASSRIQGLEREIGSQTRRYTAEILQIITVLDRTLQCCKEHLQRRDEYRSAAQNYCQAYNDYLAVMGAFEQLLTEISLLKKSETLD